MVDLSPEPPTTTVSTVALRPAAAAVQAAIESAHGVDELAAAAAKIRDLVTVALDAGDSAVATTRLISRLNDRVTEQLVQRMAAELGLDLGHACWLVFGSQGRAEQTLATDQDNGLIFDSDDPESARAGWLELGRRVNRALDDCGYSLCRGNVMAGQPDCCLTSEEWCNRFDRWMEHGAPADLLNASIYFDLRALVGRRELATPMRNRITSRAAMLPRFQKQMAENALRNPVALSWFGTVRARRRDGRRMFDLKLQGTALFVEAARLYALAQGLADATSTDERLTAVGLALNVPAQETATWRRGFEVLQRLRLRLQLQARSQAPTDNPNLVALDELEESDLGLLTQTLRAARLLQQRIELDYRR